MVGFLGRSWGVVGVVKNVVAWIKLRRLGKCSSCAPGIWRPGSLRVFWVSLL